MKTKGMMKVWCRSPASYATLHVPFHQEASFCKRLETFNLDLLRQSAVAALVSVSPARRLPPHSSRAHVLRVSPLATAVIWSLPPMDVAQADFYSSPVDRS